MSVIEIKTLLQPQTADRESKDLVFNHVIVKTNLANLSETKYRLKRLTLRFRLPVNHYAIAVLLTELKNSATFRDHLFLLVNRFQTYDCSHNESIRFVFTLIPNQIYPILKYW